MTYFPHLHETKPDENFCMANDTKKETDGYHADLRLGKTDFEEDCILLGDNVCRLSETFWTSCANDGFGNCGGYSCDLCEFNDCPR